MDDEIEKLKAFPPYSTVARISTARPQHAPAQVLLFDIERRFGAGHPVFFSAHEGFTMVDPKVGNYLSRIFVVGSNTKMFDVMTREDAIAALSLEKRGVIESLQAQVASLQAQVAALQKKSKAPRPAPAKRAGTSRKPR